MFVEGRITPVFVPIVEAPAHEGSGSAICDRFPLFKDKMQFSR
jgi:hypothetical protein